MSESVNTVIELVLNFFIFYFLYIRDAVGSHVSRLAVRADLGVLQGAGAASWAEKMFRRHVLHATKAKGGRWYTRAGMKALSSRQTVSADVSTMHAKSLRTGKPRRSSED